MPRPKGPSRTKTLRNSELLCYDPHNHYAVNPSLRGEMPLKPRKMMSTQRGNDSKSLCNCKFTTRSKLLNLLSSSIVERRGSLGKPYIALVPPRGPKIPEIQVGQKQFRKDAAFLLSVGSFLLTVELFYLQSAILAFLLTVGAFLLTIWAFLLTVGAFLLTVGKCL